MPRILRFVAMQEENQYPNHRKFVASMHKLDEADVFNISSKTVQGNVESLNVNYSAHIQYGYQQHGYYHEEVFHFSSGTIRHLKNGWQIVKIPEGIYDKLFGFIMSMSRKVTVPVPDSLRDEVRNSALEFLRMLPDKAPA